MDDIPDNCQLLENILSPIGFRLRVTDNGKEAIAVWQDWQPDLILMDIQMPQMNGYQAVEIIRQQEQKMGFTPTKIIAVTASIFDEQADNICQFGFDDIVRKPFTEDIIFEHLQSNLQLEYIYDESTKDASVVLPLSVDDLLQEDILSNEMGKMSLDWLHQVIASASRGSDDELLMLIEEIPSHLINLREVLNHLTNEFLFEEIIDLISLGDNRMS